MKLTYIGISRRVGISDKGNHYDMCKLLHAVPLQNKKTEKYEFTTLGCRAVEINAKPECMKEFEGLTVGEEIEVVMEPDPYDARFNIVAGLA